MARHQPQKTRYPKKTVKYTEAFKERILVSSGKKVRKRDSQVLCYESSLKFNLGKAK